MYPFYFPGTWKAQYKDVLAPQKLKGKSYLYLGDLQLHKLKNWQVECAPKLFQTDKWRQASPTPPHPILPIPKLYPESEWLPL
jgi:hypothetical protein